MLRVKAGSAQISIFVRSGPIPASDNAAATFTFAGNPLAASRADAVEYFERFGNSFDVDVVCDDIGSAGEPPDRLPGHHPDRMDGPDRGGGYGVEADQRAGGHDNLTAILPGKFDEVLVVEQRTCAEDDRGLSGADKRRNDRPDQFARGAFDDDVGDFDQRLDRQDDRRSRQAGKPASVLFGVLHRHGGEHQTIYSPVQRFDDPGSNCSQPGNRNAQVWSHASLQICHRDLRFKNPALPRSPGSGGADAAISPARPRPPPPAAARRKSAASGTARDWRRS